MFTYSAGTGMKYLICVCGSRISSVALTQGKHDSIIPEASLRLTGNPSDRIRGSDPADPGSSCLSHHRPLRAYGRLGTSELSHFPGRASSDDPSRGDSVGGPSLY
eukprot:767677-Hanusia_phi.AAC.6